MKWILLSFLAFMLAAPPIAVHASPDDPLCSVLDVADGAVVFVQILAQRPAVATVTPIATYPGRAMISSNATAPPVQGVAALSRRSNRTAKAPVALAYDHCFESGGDSYVSLGIAHIWRPPAVRRE